jgi:hypothetical protein
MFQVRGTISRRGLFQEIFTPTSCSMLSTQVLAFAYFYFSSIRFEFEKASAAKNKLTLSCVKSREYINKNQTLIGHKSRCIRKKVITRRRREN